MEVIESDELVFIDKSTIGQSEVGESIQIPPQSVADVPQTPLPDDLHRNSSLITLDATPSGEVQFHLPPSLSVQDLSTTLHPRMSRVSLSNDSVSDCLKSIQSQISELSTTLVERVNILETIVGTKGSRSCDSKRNSLVSFSDEKSSSSANARIHSGGLGTSNSCARSNELGPSERFVEAGSSGYPDRSQMKFGSSESYQFSTVNTEHICSQDRYMEIPSGETATGKSARHSLMDDKPPVGACSQSIMDAWSRSAQPATQGMAQFPSHSPQGPVGTAECVGEVMRVYLKKPATYDGKTSWQDYYIQFEMVSELNAWNDTVKAIQLATSLRGVAQQVLSDVPPIYRKDFNYLVHTLSQRFEPKRINLNYTGPK